jgi:hypothetical protein
MGLLFKQLRKLHEAHEARYVLSARRTLSFNTNSDEILELMRTSNHIMKRTTHKVEYLIGQFERRTLISVYTGLCHVVLYVRVNK